LVCEIDIPTSATLDIYDSMVDFLECADEDGNMRESKCHALLSILPPPTMNGANDGGISCIAVGLLHYHAKVRRLVINILQILEKNASTRYLCDKMSIL